MPLPAEGIWAVLEIMGHRRIAGHIVEDTIAGAPMLRVDIPGPNASDPVKATQYYGGASLFCMTPTTEELARKEANQPAWSATPYQLGNGEGDDPTDEEDETLP
jgi:hypothetical protein